MFLKFHKEGAQIILISTLLTAIIVLLADSLLSEYFYIQKIVQVLCIVFLILILQFFRNPTRKTPFNADHIISPVDGKVVVIEEVFEPEFLKNQCRQVSIFMSPINVHVTRYPMSGNVIFSQYHAGKFLVAWHPKASTDNERTTVVVENQSIGKVLYRQIAGALAKRIVNYAQTNQRVVQGEDAGFIKFGSRVDLYLPLDLDINVNLNQKVKGGITVVAKKNG